MLVKTNKATHVFSDMESYWIEDSCLFIKYKHYLTGEQIDMIPLCNIDIVSCIDIELKRRVYK